MDPGDAESRVRELLTQDGFGLLTDIDMDAAAVMGVVRNQELPPVGADVMQRLHRVAGRLSTWRTATGTSPELK